MLIVKKSSNWLRFGFIAILIVCINFNIIKIADAGQVWYSAASNLPMQTNTGSNESDGGRSSVPGQNITGYVTYGPYISTLPAGDYHVTWRLMTGDNTFNSSPQYRIEVSDFTAGQQIIASKNLYGGDWSSSWANQNFALNFSITPAMVGHQLEFRTFWYGQIWDRIQYISADTGFVDIPTPTPAPTTPPPTPPSVNCTLQQGLVGKYFDNIDFTLLKLNHVDGNINFDWGGGSPDASISPDTFSVRWTGYIKPQYTQQYTFYTTSDDGSKLWINGQLVVNNWGDHAASESSGVISLVANQLYPIQLDFYENGGGAQVSMSWSSSSQAKQVVPASQLQNCVAVSLNNDWNMFMSDNFYEGGNSAVVPLLNPPTKKGVVLTGDRAYESVLILARNILDDPITLTGTTYRYRMYYSADTRSFNDPVYGYRNLALAVSNDGLTWIKPTLSLYNCGERCGNTTANNLMAAPPMQVLRDNIDSNSARRYKALDFNEPSKYLVIWYSSDGLTWTKNNVHALDNIYVDTVNSMGLSYDQQNSNYYAFVRSWKGGGSFDSRCVSRITISPAQLMGTWPTQTTYSNGEIIADYSDQPMCRPDDASPVRKGGYYNPGYSQYPFASNIQLFMPSWLNENPNSPDYQLNQIYVAYRRNLGGNANTPDNDSTLNSIFIQHGDIYSNDRTNYIEPLVIQTGTDKESFYYSGYPGTHSQGITATNGLPYMFRAEGRLRGIITLKTSSNVTLSGNLLRLPPTVSSLHINAKALGTSSIKIAFTDVNGNEIQGFGLAQAIAFTGDNVDATVAWSGSPNLASLAGQDIRIKWQIIASTNYPVERAAFQFKQ